MELFAITCTTCKSRLNVRDPAAIGQILACPKCGGMVMVKPPPAFSEVGEQRSDLPTATEMEGPALQFGQTPNSSAFDGLDEMLSDAPPRVPPPRPSVTPTRPSVTPTRPSVTPPPAAPTTPKPRFVDGPPVHRSSTPAPVKASATPPPPPGSAPVTQPSAATKTTATKPTPPAEPPTKKKSSSSSELPPPPAEAAAPPPAIRPRSNYLLLMTASIVLGIGLALIAVCGVILLRPTGPKIAQAATPTKKPVPVTSKSVASNKKATSPASSPKVSQPEPAPQPQPELASAPTVTPVESTPATTASPVANPPPTDDPPGLTAAPAPSAPVAKPALDSLAKFDSLIGGPGNDPLAKPAPLVSADSSPPSVVPDNTSARPLAPRPPLREIDVAKCLAVQLLGIEASGTTLADFVQMMSDLSTIPITLDVPFPPATPQSLVTLKATNTTVGKALSEALSPLLLEYVVSDDQLIIRRPEPNPFAALTHDVKDLAGANEPQLTELVDLLQAVVEPGSWGDGDGQGSIAVDAAKGVLTIRHRRAVQFQVLVALEKLRASHAPPLPPKAKMDSAYVNLDSRLKQAGPRLAKPISLNYGQPTRLVTIFDRLGEAAGMRILVDWRDVARAGWNPAGEGTLVANKQPLDEALEAMLTPLDLTVRIIDAQTLQIVTPIGLAEREELEFYKVSDLLSGETTADALIAKIRAALGDEAFVSGGGSGEIRFDHDTKCLLAWLPQLKQWQLEALLAQWRKKTL